jgi:hypothetical protein
VGGVVEILVIVCVPLLTYLYVKPSKNALRPYLCRCHSAIVDILVYTMEIFDR